MKKLTAHLVLSPIYAVMAGFLLAGSPFLFGFWIIGKAMNVIEGKA